MKPPGGFVTFLSILWFSVGLGYIALSLVTGQHLWFPAPVIMIPSFLLWRGSYNAANFLILCLIGRIFIDASKLLLHFNELPWQSMVATPALISFNAFAIYALWKWSDARNPECPPHA